MSIQNLFLSLLHLITTFIFIFITFSSAASATIDEELWNCIRPFRCGNFFQEINYPFWGGNRSRECGLSGFELKCQQNDFVTIDIENQTYRVININQSYPSFTIARNDLWGDLCPEVYQSTELPNITTFRYGQDVEMMNISYFCPSPDRNFPEKNAFTCDNNDNNNRSTNFFGDQWVSPDPACGLNITVPVLESSLIEFRNRPSMTLQQLLNRGFRLDYGTNSCSSCGSPRGECWSMINPSELPGGCFCRDRYTCSLVNRGGGLNVGRKVGIAFGAAAFGAIVMGFSFFWYQWRQRKRDSPSVLISRNISSYSCSWTDHEKSGSNFGVHIFSYDELEEATKDFDSSKILGDGGFGTVYKGELQDGRVVAVKRLYENNYRMVEQFITEVEILTRMRHSNLVSLYGCTSRHSHELLLVYEYIPNGTVADHLHGVLARPGGLPWSTRMSIALETASALAYLHASDIIHRDVKTNNILLDKNFSVKVADFGLSRLFPIHLTHISTAPQGTPGYVDPEYHDCYQLTDKSDVYSFGVVLIELISSKPAVDITRHRHEINLSNMAINRIQNHALHELVDPDLGYATDSKVTTMICLVAELAFQCLQHGRDMRPSMHEVLKTLEEIKKKEQNSSQMEVIDIPADDVVLLSNGTLHSPDSFMGAFVSMSTTSSSSN